MRLVLLWTVYEMADRPAPGAVYRDKTFGLAEISSTCAPTTWPSSSTRALTAWPRSVRRVRLQFVEIGPPFQSASIVPSSCLLHC